MVNPNLTLAQPSGRDYKNASFNLGTTVTVPSNGETLSFLTGVSSTSFYMKRIRGTGLLTDALFALKPLNVQFRIYLSASGAGSPLSYPPNCIPVSPVENSSIVFGGDAYSKETGIEFAGDGLFFGAGSVIGIRVNTFATLVATDILFCNVNFDWSL